MARLRGRSQKGRRLIASLPHGHWKTLTFIAGLRADAITAPMVLDGPMNRAAFETYVERFLAPTLQPGDVVVADNLGSHKSPTARAVIEARGARLWLLPPYSPDLNPIEMAFSKLKAHVRAAAARTVDDLHDAIANALDRFSECDCRNFFNHAGYA